MRRTLFAAAAIGALVLVAPEALAAQDPPPPPQPPTDTELVFEREVFSYPSFTRRNPFRPLSIDEDGGPRFESLSLVGIIYSSDPDASVAVVSTGGVSVNEDGTTSPVDGDAYHLKVGASIGNTTIREIHRDRVEVTVTEFDEQIMRTMVFASRRQGGSQ